MKSAVFISDNTIYAVAGEDTPKAIRADSCFSRTIPDGILKSGHIADHNGFSSLIKSYFSECNLPLKDAVLILESGLISIKPLEIPSLSQKQILALIKNEFTASGGKENDMLYDYAVLKSGITRDDLDDEEGGEISQAHKIYAVNAERVMIEEYAAAFKNAGIILSSIDSAFLCAARFFLKSGGFKKKTFIYSHIDAQDMVSSLYADCEFIFSNRARLTERRGTPSAAVEISRALSAMIQFNYVRSVTAAPLSHAYISGLSGEEVLFYSDMNDALAISVEPLPKSAKLTGKAFADKDYGAYLYCLGGLIT